MDVPSPGLAPIPVALEGTASTQITDANTDKNGTTTFTATTTGTSGFQNLAVVGGLAPGGTIDIKTNLVVTKDGKRVAILSDGSANYYVGIYENGPNGNGPAFEQINEAAGEIAVASDQSGNLRSASQPR